MSIQRSNAHLLDGILFAFASFKASFTELQEDSNDSSTITPWSGLQEFLWGSGNATVTKHYS